MINRVLSLTTIVLIAFYVTSCSEEKDDTSIVLEKNNVELIAGAIDTVAILSDSSEFIVTTNNDEVASAIIKGMNIIICTSQNGKCNSNSKRQAEQYYRN